MKDQLSARTLQDSARRRARHLGCASRIALAAGLALAAAACAKTDTFNAALCTRAAGEAPQKACENPKTPVALTLPRAELLQRVPASETEVTGSTGEGAPALAQTKEADPPPAPAAAPAATAPAASPPAANAPTQITPPEAPAAAAPNDKAKSEGPDARLDALRRAKELANDQPDPAQPAQASSRPNRIEQGFRRSEKEPAGPALSMAEAVRRAIGDHPLIGVAGARVNEAAASVGVSESALYPQVEGRLAVGPGAIGSYQTSANLGYFSNDNAYGAFRAEGSLAGRQLLFDFGAARADVARASALHLSERLKQREQIEDVVSKVADVYMKIMEQRELLAAATENVAALEKIVKLVEDNERNGNGTVADMKRVRSRLVDGQTALADAKSELQTGGDRFRRLVRTSPGVLKPAPNLSNAIPRSVNAALTEIPKSNPRIQALEETLRAARHEAESQKANGLPKVSFESDVGVKEYRTRVDKTEVDAKGMVVFKYNFLDGGLQSRQVEQVTSRVLQTELRLRNDIEEAEAEVRKHYRILESARGKAESLKENVATALKALQLYDEQFRGGKRTLLELLDIQTTYNVARRTQIANKYEEQRAVNGVLLSIGRLTDAMLSTRTAELTRSRRR